MNQEVFLPPRLSNVLNLEPLCFQVSRTAEAEQWFRRAQKLAPNDYSVYHHYGEQNTTKSETKERNSRFIMLIFRSDRVFCPPFVCGAKGV